jgi:glycosyltransferase involved in cell wall biosynthesis
MKASTSQGLWRRLLPRPKASIVVISYNMARELPRTIRSLSPAMQRGVAAEDYEIIVVDNGSTEAFDERALAKLAPNLTLRQIHDADVSPVKAINLGLELARGDLVGVCIDGARMATPGLVARAIAAGAPHQKPVIGTIAFHLGPKVQPISIKEGYDQAAEDALLESSGWEEDPYRLFDVSVFAVSSGSGWFVTPMESNAFFCTAAHWRELGFWDERFVSPGGGLVNLDSWRRAIESEGAQLVLLLGEATFHQVHGGVATNSVGPPISDYFAEYERIRGFPYERPKGEPLFFGSLPPTARASFRASLERL